MSAAQKVIDATKIAAIVASVSGVTALVEIDASSLRRVPGINGPVDEDLTPKKCLYAPPTVPSPADTSNSDSE
jgi:hypothetical protein